MSGETLDQTDARAGAPAGPAPAPGLVLVFAGGRPAAVPLRLGGGEVELGRDHPLFGAEPDRRMSRRHARVRFDGERFWVTDAGSRNGTSADGALLAPRVERAVERVIRIGNALLVPVRDVGPLERLGVRRAEGRVEGPALQEAQQAAARAARSGSTLHITGESGAGKEGLARAFHAGGPRPSGPFQAVNCAAIPEGVAERLLFGAKRGAYSGADADADGYVQSAHEGTLFLDEVAELSLPVQAKLLRAIETGEVLPLGASKARRIDLRFCSATHRDLRAQVVAGKLREDLFFRIATPRVVVPPLRERPEEIAWLLEAAAAEVSPALALHPSLVEVCLLRPWPGNLRELCAEARSAAYAAHTAGVARVEPAHLAPTAGAAFAAAKPLPAKERAARRPAGPAKKRPTRARIVAALSKFEGNISAVARALRVHRTQLRRWMDQDGLDPRAYAPGDDRDDTQ